MKLERAITVEESRSTLEARTIAYLEQAGYKQVSSQTSIIYRRGSIFGTWLSFSPKSWQVQATTQIVSSENTSDVSIKFDVDTHGLTPVALQNQSLTASVLCLFSPEIPHIFLSLPH